jgi:hypothetical protein
MAASFFLGAPTIEANSRSSAPAIGHWTSAARRVEEARFPSLSDNGRPNAATTAVRTAAGRGKRQRVLEQARPISLERRRARPWRRLAARLCAAAFLLGACSVDDRAVGVLAPMLEGASGGSGGGSAGAPPGASGGATAPNGVSAVGTPCSGDACGATPCTTCAPSSTTPPPRSGGCSDGQQRCVTGAPEVCSGGAWFPGAACADPLPYCLERTGGCVACSPGATRCNGTAIERCSADGAWTDAAMPCADCVPGDTGCNGTTALSCTDDGRWQETACAATEPSCVPATGSCACTPTSCGARQACAASGHCEALTSDCPAPAPVRIPEQDLGIVKVHFIPDGSADAVIENIGTGFLNYGVQGYQLCNGTSNCVYLAETASITLLPGSTFSFHMPNTVASGGELAIVLLGVTPGDPNTQAYVAWGTGAGANGLETQINASAPYWAVGDRVQVAAGDTGFVCTGDTSRAAGYTSCNP